MSQSVFNHMGLNENNRYSAYTYVAYMRLYMRITFKTVYFTMNDKRAAYNPIISVSVKQKTCSM